MDVKDTKRIQNNVIDSLEKKTLKWLAERMPRWVTSDFLTFIGFLGSLMIGAGFVLTHWGMNWLWLTIAGLFVNWYGDSLDGTLARVRNTQRPVYGFYLDHTMDVVNETLMFLGLGFSPLVHLPIALSAFVLYLALTLNVSMNTHLRGEFKLSYFKLGPTEFRIIVVLICLIFIFCPAVSGFARPVSILGNHYVFGIFDFIALGIVAVLGLIWVVTIISDIRYYSRVDPPKKFKK